MAASPEAPCASLRACFAIGPGMSSLRRRWPSNTYRSRVLIGPSYRADMWAALEREPSLSPSELARRGYGSYATAWQIKRDRDLLAG